MSAVRAPKTLAAATALLERYAALDGAIAGIEARRNRVIARANAAADNRIEPMLAERAAIAEKLEPWWQAAGAALLAKGRKTLMLGGCNIGSRTSRARLVHGFENDDAAVAALKDKAARLFKQTTKVRDSLDRTAIAKMLQLKGAAGELLTRLGFKTDQGEEFVLERAEQAGTIGASG